MIFNGARFLFSPIRAWAALSRPEGYATQWMVASAIAASLIPTIAVVLGHLGSGWLGHTAHETAIQRAAIGFVATSIGAVVMAPALALALFRVGEHARIHIPSQQGPMAAMGLIWPAWFCGLVLALPPLLNMGPEIGELLWVLLAALCALRVIDNGASEGLGVRRRWRGTFRLQALGVFVVLFVSISIAPALLMRHLVGVTGTILYGDPSAMEWPLPPTPDW